MRALASGKTDQGWFVRQTLSHPWASGGLGAQQTTSRPPHRFDLRSLRRPAARPSAALGLTAIRTGFEKRLRLPAARPTTKVRFFHTFSECRSKSRRPGDLPVNLHFVIEGEEEIGSGNLGNFLSQNRAALSRRSSLFPIRDDFAWCSDYELRLRGVAALELKITGPKMDLHLGIYGGGVANPLTAMARLLATLHDANGHIAIPGFYDEVLPLEDWEREMWRKIPVNLDEEILKETGIPKLFGEKGFSTMERIGRARQPRSMDLAAVTRGRESRR